MNVFDCKLPDEQATLAFGTKLASCCSPPLVIFLLGQLGAGKTTFVRGFLRGLGYRAKVKSPSYNLVECYEFENQAVCHFDFYRIQDPHELDFMGLQEYWQSSTIFLIEWPEKVASFLPAVDLVCSLETAGEGRALHMEAKSALGLKVLSFF